MAKVEITVDEQLREDLLVTALEGGSNDWYFLDKDALEIINKYREDKSVPISTAMWAAIKDGKSIPVRDIGEDDEEDCPLLGEINLQKIEIGEQLMADNYKADFMQLVNEGWDAATANIWFQLAVMGRVDY